MLSSFYRYRIDAEHLAITINTTLQNDLISRIGHNDLSYARVPHIDSYIDEEKIIENIEVK